MRSPACSISAPSRCRRSSDDAAADAGPGRALITGRDRRPRPSSPSGSLRRLRARLVVSRVFIALTAVCLVVAFAIAALAPMGLTLAGGLQRLDDGAGGALQRHVPAAVWQELLVPFLVRPAWVLPIMVGLISAGLAISIRRPTGIGLRRR